jgi:tRNA G18 (ribose-2'-O)-methylase SpoU
MKLTLIMYNLRSSFNVGSILRTADAVGVSNIIAVGTTPYPEIMDDQRPPHVRSSNTKSISKSALGAELSVNISYQSNIKNCLSLLLEENYTLLALEQADNSINIFDYLPTTDNIALILGPEVEGITTDVLEMCSSILEIPMYGKKESLNVSVAAGIALYQLRNNYN